jgi:hypothetical protein
MDYKQAGIAQARLQSKHTLLGIGNSGNRERKILTTDDTDGTDSETLDQNGMNAF